MKKDKLNRILVAFLTAFILSSIVANFGNPLIAVGTGFLASIIATYSIMGFNGKKSVILDTISSAVASQAGWLALLI